MFNPMQMFQGMGNGQNPMMQMMQQIGRGGNPTQMMQGMMQSQLQNNPLFQRAQEMAKGKSPDELKQIAQNLCKQRGIDIDQAMEQFKSQMGSK